MPKIYQKKCKWCGKKDRSPRKYFCSQKCYWKWKKGKNIGGFPKGHISWLKGTKGLIKSNSGSFKKGNIPWSKGKSIPQLKGNQYWKLRKNNPTGKDHWLWKGENVAYQNLHNWVYRHKGRPQKCSICGKKGIRNGSKWSIHWANKDHKYRRNLDDYIALCVRCHKRYDLKNNLHQEKNV